MHGHMNVKFSVIKCIHERTRHRGLLRVENYESVYFTECHTERLNNSVQKSKIKVTSCSKLQPQLGRRLLYFPYRHVC
jgi:hypothetical protein